MPLGNHGARARHAQRRLALSQATYELRSTLATVTTEVEVAVREVRTTFEETIAKSQSVIAAQAEVNHLEARWRVMAGDNGVASLALEDLLQAHDRLLEEELSLAQSLSAYSVAVLELRRATGTLIEIDGLNFPRRRNLRPRMPEELPLPAARNDVAAKSSEWKVSERKIGGNAPNEAGGRRTRR
jgi:outer membrane protein TolC